MEKRHLIQLVLSIFFLAFIVDCQSSQEIVKENEAEEAQEYEEKDLLPPPFDGEEIIDENGEVVPNHKKEEPYFQPKGRHYKEYFRVVLSSEKYKVRQIRGSKYFKRKPDLEGDKLIQEELNRFNIVNFKDEGILDVSLNANTGGIEIINFEGKVPRINEIAKLIQNDVMRWTFEHKMIDEKAQITRFRVYYRIILQQKLTREEVRELIKKKRR